MTVDAVADAVVTITQAEWDQAERHGYAGPLSKLVGPSRGRWAAAGADGWQLAGEDGMTVLRPVKVAP